MGKLRAAIILDDLKITQWQKLALEEAADILDIKIILNCKNTKTKKNLSKNFLYYSLNTFTLKNKLTKKADYTYSNEETLSFQSIYKGNWQYIPDYVSKKIRDNKIDVIIKFGMNLLKVDDSLSEVPILSFHHGDPSKFRGRPAGFYELLRNEDKSGLIVQRITNELDAGHILAFAESKLTHYSYKKSAESFYQESQFLLRKALLNLEKNNVLKIKTGGKNYRLPSNSTVLKFSAILFKRRVEHLIYGAFFEKKWKVGTVKFNLGLRNDNVINSSLVDNIPIKQEYSFYADPFFSSDGSKIRLEGLRNKSGLGDILEIDSKNLNNSKILLTGKHYSYPFSFLLDDEEQILPEVASHSPQYFFSLSGNKEDLTIIKGLEKKRIVDATILNYDNTWYMFFGEKNSSSSRLNLWVADTIDGKFKEHPNNPICISPSSARMAGRILITEDGIFRFGQNNSRAYGAAITISEITKLNRDEYKEEVCGTIKMDKCYGPHTIDINKEDGVILIDYYTDEFSKFASIRRVKNRLAKS